MHLLCLVICSYTGFSESLQQSLKTQDRSLFRRSSRVVNNSLDHSSTTQFQGDFVAKILQNPSCSPQKCPKGFVQI